MSNIKFAAYEPVLLQQVLNKNEMTGGGIFDWMKKGYQAVQRFVSGPRKQFSPAIRKFLEQHGNKRIEDLVVARKPIFAVIEKVANLISLGQWEQNKAQFPYDKMFHLYLIFVIDGKSYKIEKNEVIMLRPDDTDSEVETMQVPRPRMLFLNQLIDNAQQIVSPTEFFQYHSYSTNCQHFIQTLLKGSRLLTPQLNAFIMQDAQQIMDIRGFKTISDAATGLAGSWNHAWEGAGFAGAPNWYDVPKRGGCVGIKKCPCNSKQKGGFVKKESK